jgi:diaminopropionate ammonia-lyase
MSRIIFNTEVDSPDVSPSRAPLEFHRRLPGYGVTPLVPLDDLAGELGLKKLWVKDESRRFGLPSFKILGASWATFQALDEHIGGFAEWNEISDLQRQLKPHLPLTLAAATDGNHGRAVARMAKLLGLDALIFVPAGTVQARISAITSEGATCIVFDGTYDETVARSAEEASDRCLVVSDTSWEGYERTPAQVVEGYSTIFFELDKQLGDDHPDVVFVQVGVGAFASAAIAHFRAPARPRTRMAAVEPEKAACLLASVEKGTPTLVPGPHDSIMAGLNCGMPSLIAWPSIRKGFDCYLEIDDALAEQAMRMLHDHGIVSGESGAAGLGGLVELLVGPHAKGAAKHLGLNEQTSVLIISTEGATDIVAYERIIGSPPGAHRPNR